MKSESVSEDVLEQASAKDGLSYEIESCSLRFTGEKNDTEHFIAFVKFLFDGGHVTEDDLPYVSSGKIRYLLNVEPIHQDGREMTRPVEVYSGVFLETNHDSRSKMRYGMQMIEDFVAE